ncbi:MAG TPA: FHA domain-containing protein [Planctomycetota bacterium]|nr:FHA domain-containing protein [Planctomycetota bacterium]
MASLTIVVEGVEQKIPLEAASVTLGRGLESDVRLKDIKASRRHCQVVKTPKGYQCIDLSSGNGTYINGIQIKTQMLSPGDKITIGSTTVLFEDAPRSAVSSKAATAKLPAVAGPAPAKAAAPRVATAKVQVAPTKRTTERVEAVKSASQAGIKPATHPISKSGSRLGRTTGRAAAPRPSRPPVESPGKRSPVLLGAGVVVLLLVLGAGGYVFFASKDSSDQVRDQIEQYLKKGNAAKADERYDEALLEYRKAFDLCQGDRYKIRASEITKLIAQVEIRKGSAASSKPEKKEAPNKDGEFQAKKTEIAEKHRLGDTAAADWGGALKDWTEFAARKSAADATREHAEIRALQAKAQEEASRLKEKADALTKENKMAEAVDLLKRQSGRFEGTDAKAELDAAIRQLDK